MHYLTGVSFDRTLVVSLALMVAAPSGVSQAIAPQDGAPVHRLAGQVVSSLTHEPIARALVRAGRHAVLTDHQGHFEFDNVGDDGQPVSAARPGYFFEDDRVAAPADPITLQLIPEASLAGTATDQKGQPIQDLMVQLKMLQIRNGLRHWEQIQSTRTNVEGEYRFAELRAGQYRVATGFRVEGPPEASSSLAFVPLVYPTPAGDGVSDALTLSPGDRTQADLSPPVEKLYRVAGLLDGAAGQGANFEIMTQQGEMVSPSARVYPTGEFWLMLPSGTYHVKANSFSPQEQRTGTRDIVVGQAPLQGVAISLQPPASLPVEVEYQSVATGTEQEQSNAPPFLNLSLEQADSAGPSRVYPGEPLTAPANGQAPEPGVIRNVEPGRYEIRAQTNPPWYLASATCGNVDLMREPLVIAEGAGVCTIRAVLRNDAASVKWSIAGADSGGGGAKPFGLIPVVAIPLGNITQTAQSSFPSEINNSTARGELSGIAPGRYLILALQRQQELPYRDPGAVARYLSLGQEVTLVRNGQADVQLQIVVGEP